MQEKIPLPKGDIGKLTLMPIVDEVKRSYLEYAMSVIVSRALPDVRDGLKPVHRRILYAMNEIGLKASAGYRKSAAVVGEVLAKYHPHGDAAVYDSMVRMAQDFSMRYTLVKGQGNFGSIDGDNAAAMRYTEVKLAKISDEMVTDIEKETTPFIDNFDGSLKEPVYLPAKLPNLLLMGAEGIAVGMATKIPPHNLSELVDALVFMIDKAKLNDAKKFKKSPMEDVKELLFNTTLKDNKEFFGRMIVDSKIDVNGKNAHPLYQFLVREKSGFFGGSIKWNFTKFLINKKGIPVERYASVTTPDKLEKDIEKLLAE